MLCFIRNAGTVCGSISELACDGKERMLWTNGLRDKYKYNSIKAISNVHRGLEDYWITTCDRDR